MPEKKKPFAIVVHGGAGPDSDRIKEHEEEYHQGLQEAVEAGYKVLESGGTAIEAVEAAVNSLEDNPNFNAGRGSALNADGEIEMDAAIMDGKNRASGAVAIVRNVKNPVSLAKSVMLNTNYRFLGDAGAMKYAKSISIDMRPDSYFITEHQYDAFEKKRKEEFESINDIAMDQVRRRLMNGTGTVGAVALDQEGNLAAATSTGGIENKKAGRIGDSCVIGVGCFASNETCAISSTGDGELLMKKIVAHNVSAAMEHKGMGLQEACDYVVKGRNENETGDIGIIGVDKEGNIGIAFNSERMHRAWRTNTRQVQSHIYPGKQAMEKAKEKDRQKKEKQ